MGFCYSFLKGNPIWEGTGDIGLVSKWHFTHDYLTAAASDCCKLTCMTEVVITSKEGGECDCSWQCLLLLIDIVETAWWMLPDINTIYASLALCAWYLVDFPQKKLLMQSLNVIRAVALINIIIFYMYANWSKIPMIRFKLHIYSGLSSSRFS